jgi:hypothetical protein
MTVEEEWLLEELGNNQTAAVVMKAADADTAVRSLCLSLILCIYSTHHMIYWTAHDRLRARDAGQ